MSWYVRSFSFDKNSARTLISVVIISETYGYVEKLSHCVYMLWTQVTRIVLNPEVLGVKFYLFLNEMDGYFYFVIHPSLKTKRENLGQENF